MLALTVPEYGMQIVESSVAPAGQSNIAARAIVGQTLFILLMDGMTTTFITQIGFSKRNLTQAQAEQWMDDGFLPPTQFTLTEYRLVDEGVYTEVLTNGSRAYSEVRSGRMTPDDADGTFTFDLVGNNTFKFGVAASTAAGLVPLESLT